LLAMMLMTGTGSAAAIYAVHTWRKAKRARLRRRGIKTYKGERID
jgi:hypothetical protein